MRLYTGRSDYFDRPVSSYMRPFVLTSLLVRIFSVGLILILCACLPLQKPQTDFQPAMIVWSGTVEIDGDTIFAPATELIILPGTEVVFLPADPARDTLQRHPNFIGYELIIQGRVTAVGTADRPIIFRSSDLASGAGSWGGINLVESPDARFEFCQFMQADSAVHGQKSKITVENSLFARNRVGVRFYDSEILIENNLFHNNQTAIRFHFGAPVICLNIIRNNEQGLFVTSYPRDYLIENNTFEQNRYGNVILGEEVP
ncbi:MAG: right-handed parallel beta-helix repeat-containing protein, partial [Desulfuromonadales bacterium]|nr:right-handed parallel beta-helix repeat-containing protein [Desulfuromonadales bacterium]